MNEYWCVCCEECGKPIPLREVRYDREGNPSTLKAASGPQDATCYECGHRAEYLLVEAGMRELKSLPPKFRPHPSTL